MPADPGFIRVGIAGMPPRERIRLAYNFGACLTLKLHTVGSVAFFVLAAAFNATAACRDDHHQTNERNVEFSITVFGTEVPTRMDFGNLMVHGICKLYA